MGNQATVVVFTDALHEIENDKDFGRSLAQAITDAYCHHGTQFSVSSGCHGSAATVVEAHHADDVRVVLVGGNCGVDLGWVGRYPIMPNRADPKELAAAREAVLRSLANTLGFTVSKKREQRKKVAKTS